MTVFKTYLKVLKKYIGTIVLYTVMLLFFAGFNMQTNDTSTNFNVTKPDILLINHDSNEGITKTLTDYLSDNCIIADIKNDENLIKDALFYRDISYIIEIPENYRNDFLNHKNPQIKIEQTGDYESSLASMILTRFVKTANTYNDVNLKEDEIINYVNQSLSNKIEVNVTSKLDTTVLSKVAFYYNFLNYSILAGCVYVICLILSSFRKESIKKRTIISSMNYKKYNRYLLLSNGLFAVIMWLFYVLLSFILIGSSMFSIHGLLYMLNSFIFTLCALSLAFLISNLLSSKNAINGIINVVALGSSFLCGAFVPTSFLPDSVLSVAHILPSYWYINGNELLKNIEAINLNSLKQLINNMIIVLLFTILFIVISNYIYRKKRKIG